MASAGSELLNALKAALKLVAEVQEIAQDTNNLISDANNQTPESIIADTQEETRESDADIEVTSVISAHK